MDVRNGCICGHVICIFFFVIRLYHFLSCSRIGVGLVKHSCSLIKESVKFQNDSVHMTAAYRTDWHLMACKLIALTLVV